MSTRCQIGFYEETEKDLKNFQSLLYRHSDGYPGKADGSKYGVLADIIPFLKDFNKRRGVDDLIYASARLLQWLCNEYDKKTKSINPDPNPFTGVLGHGICKEFHWDIEYFYKVSPSKVEVYETPIPEIDDEIDTSTFKLIETIAI